VHFFTSQFYTKLANEGTDSVTSWTAKKDMDIFTKKFIFIPVNQSLNPGAIMNQVLPPNDDAPLSCLFFFDSLRAYRKATIAKNVQNWLNAEWKRLTRPKKAPRKVPLMRIQWMSFLLEVSNL
jgi:Ulp1 family protease